MDRIGLKVFIAIAIALGGVFELAKRASWPETTSDAVVIQQATEFAGNPYARRALSPRERAARGHVQPAPAKFTVTKAQRALMIPPTHGQFDSNGPAAIANGKQKPQTQDKNAAADKRKKWDIKKRYDPVRHCLRKRTPEEQEEFEAIEGGDPQKKEVAANKNGEPEVEKIEECEDDEQVADKDEERTDDRDDNEQPDSEFAAAGTAAVSGGIFTNHNEGEDLAGLEEWKKRVLNYPDFKETVRLIQAVQSGELSSAVFHKIVELMLADPRQDMKELGILAAGRTPSFESFHVLVKVVKSENFGSRLRVRAEAELNAYEQPTFLPLLDKVLRNSPDVFAVVWATRQLEDSAKTYLTAKYMRPVPGQTQATKNPYVATFQKFVLVLEELTKSGNDPQETSQARQTLDSIRQLLRTLS